MTKRKDPKDCKPGGRPTKYKAVYATDKYIDEFIAQSKEDKKLVSLVGLACYINVTEETLQNWAKANPKFLRSLNKVMRTSKEMLLNGGLNSTYNSTIAKLILSANHGVREKTEIEHSGGLNVIITN